jgi:hypothetical protein
MEQALEALEAYATHQRLPGPCPVRDAEYALRAALAEPVQEPVAWMTPGQDLHLNNGEGFRFSDWTPLYPHPPRREWQGLTEEEIQDLWLRTVTEEQSANWFAKAIEQVLRSNNHE